MSIEATSAWPRPKRRLTLTSFAAIGVLFGDIGTSPLYTLKTVFGTAGPHSAASPPNAATVLGVLSMILWTMSLVTIGKYVNFAMRFDNNGEGGIVALMTLLGIKQHQRPLIIAVGLFGVALIYSNGAITPAISVLSALEGVPSLQTYVLPAATAILLALFAAQPFGTVALGRTFSPIMLLWFVTIAALGVYGVLQHPSVFAAVDPRYGLDYLSRSGLQGFLVLGAVFLAVTGAEALWADMGFFDPKPTTRLFTFIVFPALILNYAGQAAIMLGDESKEGNPFYRLCQGPLLVPMTLLATIATVIASQSIITGAYSMTRQAIQLGWLPRMNITQTSEEGYGQIYVGAVNWLLMIVALGLTIGFGKSDNLGAAYGVAESAAMIITGALLFIAMREIWAWPLWAAGVVAGLFFIIDGTCFASNAAKFASGSYVPLLLAAMVYSAIWIWRRGATAVQRSVEATSTPLSSLLEELHAGKIARVPGTAVFLTRVKDETPPVMAWHVRQNRALREYVLALTFTVLSLPWTDPEERLSLERVDDKFWRADARRGFMERPDIQEILGECKAKGVEIDLDDVTFYVSSETIVPREDGKGIPRWQQALFAAFGRNAARMDDYLGLPRGQVVRIGRQVEI
jgi:KUP system potassium uptake protein